MPKAQLLLLPVLTVLHGSAFAQAGALPAGDQPPALVSSFAKRPGLMPAGWKRADAVLMVEAVPGLRFEPQALGVRAGDRVQLSFRNTDDLPHNLLLLRPEAGDVVATAARELGELGPRVGFVPELLEVLYHTRVVDPGGFDTIYFRAPLVPGTYPLLCSFPGHDTEAARGALTVE